MTTTLTPKIIGQAEKHHTVVLARALGGTTLDEKQWITLSQLAAPTTPEAHTTRIAALTQWDRAAVEIALGKLLASGYVHEVPSGDIEPTESGRALVATVRAASVDTITRAYSVASPEDLATTARVLEAITTRLAADLSHS
ncbi:MarR family winged helix-turn-helix transcriptional regulator [Actinomadura harenae]|uniref:MarR family transcriptional regulator n=1 Tax=Actinomadura harenae TaxID=2483351 RepID=A0A3M2M0E9_9ACTN|nr:MarR family winged helix-turn-helix transcriptional regulator [Actinomadura harenae]RMI43047.1 MarR family transcriptional regulator [Actinomadura harenae]